MINMTSHNKILQIIKQTVRATAIKYQYNLWKIYVIKKYYECPSSSPIGCEKKYGENEKNYGKKEQKYVYWNKEQLCIRS